MFELAELGSKLSRSDHQALVPTLRSDLLATHFALREANFPVIVIVAGADGAGKGEMVHHLNEWLDPRGVITHAFWDASDEERERPPYWRFWRAMPAVGRVGILFGSWYSAPIIGRVMSTMKRSSFESTMDEIVRFERMLTDSGAVIVKLWLHLPKREQKSRLKELEKEGRIGPQDWEHFARYDRFREVSESALEHTHSETAPWTVIEATDRRWREVAAATVLLESMKNGLRRAAEKKAQMKKEKGRSAKASKSSNAAASRATAEGSPGALDAVDPSASLSKDEYERLLSTFQERLSRLSWAARDSKRPVILAFEGWDAAGKGSAIRRLTQAIDPRLYSVVGIAAPTEEERAHHYLWRFWRHLPRDGGITIFDRSWYGRVLVERVEGFAPVADWERAYDEINEFERQLTEHGTVLAKFWIHISAAEQLKRFREREKVTWKQHKITDEDWRNRKQRRAYTDAIEEMVVRCSPPTAPWTLVAGNDKRYARVQILQTLVERLEEVL